MFLKLVFSLFLSLEILRCYKTYLILNNVSIIKIILKIKTMKPQVLRIGNLIYSKELDVNSCEILLPKEVGYYDLYELLRGDTFKKYSPIPLTEEWLLKFGFENNGKEDASWIHPKEPLFEVTFFVEYEWQHVWDTSYTGAQIQYLHQIQNLFYALTGEELSLSGI